MQKSRQEATKVISLLKVPENLPGVSCPLNIMKEILNIYLEVKYLFDILLSCNEIHISLAPWEKGFYIK